MRRILLWLLGGLGAIVVLLGLFYFGYNLYITYVVTKNPSTQEVVRTGDSEFQLGAYSGGDQVPPDDPAASADESLEPPPPTATSVASSPLTLQPSSTPIDAGSVAAPAATPSPQPSRKILPPTRLKISKIGVDIPIVLADNANLPRFKGAGWFLGSGYPGFRGNVVLFGHLNGVWETFARLHELAPGDEVIVQAVDAVYRYSVTQSKVVPENDVKVLAPTGDSRLTLITCTGTWIPSSRSYTHRLVVTASLGAN